MSKRIDYKDTGVDVEAGDAFVDWIQKTGTASSPFADKLISGVGGFAAIFKMQFPEIKKPCLVSSTDGVGTKIKLAAQFESYRGVGQDLVAMSVNDLICCGAQPLFFLDYYASGKLNQSAAKEFLTGVRVACHASGCALIGGETAEMPGVYHGNDFDAAGFAVGIVDEDKILGAKRVQVGDVAVAIESSGFHSNGFSLLRRLFSAEIEGASTVPPSQVSLWREKLMVPTHLYAEKVLPLVRTQKVHAIANITGGGMENIPRVMPEFTRLKLLDWRWPEEFTEVQDRSGLSRVEMLQTLNCGVGMVLIVAPELRVSVEVELSKSGLKTWSIGSIEESDQREAHVVY